MEIVFELLATLNAAIDAGAMTPNVLAFAALAISHRVRVDWQGGRMTEQQLQRLAKEMLHLERHWKATFEQKP